MTSLTASSRTQQALELARVNLTAFKQVLYRRYQRAAHLDLLDRALVQVSRYVETQGAAGIGRLIIEMPPRHGKTLTVSRYYPAWHLGRNPDHRIMLVSYGATLADKNSRMARNLISAPYYRAIFPAVHLAADRRAVDSWDLSSREGGADALGIGGGATGKGAHILDIDDPVKNRAEAESETYRERNWEAFTSDLYTRLEPGGAIILTVTRWHTDDLIGRALQMTDEHWRVLRLPALAEVHDPLGREVGEALWASRYDVERLQAIRLAQGEYGFASLYQQQPIARGSGPFDAAKIEIIDAAPDCLQVVRFYDLAVTARRSADHTVGVKLGVTADEQFVILDVWRVQKEFPDVLAGIVQNAGIDGATVRIRLEAEKAGLIGVQELLRDSRLRAYSIDAKAPEGDKYSRSLPFASRVNGHRVQMLRGDWNRALLDELGVFPLGAHDDQVDALSGAYDMLVDTGGAMTLQEAPVEFSDWRG